MSHHYVNKGGSAKNIVLIVFFLTRISIGYSQIFVPPKSLNDIINRNDQYGVFFNKYNERDQKFQQRLKKIIEKEKVDTILILLNQYMDADSSSNFQRDDREYMVYQKRGKVYVDYFYYVHLDEGKYRSAKFKCILKNKFPIGKEIFEYSVNNKIDTVKSPFKFNKEHMVIGQTSGYWGYMNIGTEFYDIGDIPKYRVSEIKDDPRLCFYQFIMRCLRKAGY